MIHIYMRQYANVIHKHAFNIINPELQPLDNKAIKSKDMGEAHIDDKDSCGH